MVASGEKGEARSPGFRVLRPGPEKWGAMDVRSAAIACTGAREIVEAVELARAHGPLRGLFTSKGKRIPAQLSV